MLGLCCADCGRIVFSIEDAADHEDEMIDPNDPDELHGGWDTVRV